MVTSSNSLYTIRFRILSDASSLHAKMSTVLSQKRLNSGDFFTFFKNKVSDLKIKPGIMLNVNLIVFSLENYVLYIKLPTLSTLLNRILFLNKNSKFSGQLLILKAGKLYYTVTPFLLYELVHYKFSYENIDNLYIRSFYNKCVHSLKGKGINIYVC